MMPAQWHYNNIMSLTQDTERACCLLLIGYSVLTVGLYQMGLEWRFQMYWLSTWPRSPEHWSAVTEKDNRVSSRS